MTSESPAPQPLPVEGQRPLAVLEATPEEVAAFARWLAEKSPRCEQCGGSEDDDLHKPDHAFAPPTPSVESEGEAK